MTTLFAPISSFSHLPNFSEFFGFSTTDGVKTYILPTLDSVCYYGKIMNDKD